MSKSTAPGHRSPAGPLEGGSQWLVDDPDAAYHLRRIEVAIAEGAVPLRDRYLNHPLGSPIPWPQVVTYRALFSWRESGAHSASDEARVPAAFPRRGSTMVWLSSW